LLTQTITMSVVFAAALSRHAGKSALRQGAVSLAGRCSFSSSRAANDFHPIPLDIEHYTSGWRVDDIEGKVSKLVTLQILSMHLSKSYLCNDPSSRLYQAWQIRD
jgi:hypothetical protein